MVKSVAAGMTPRLPRQICIAFVLAAVVSLNAAQQNAMTTDDVKKYFTQFGYMDSDMSRELASLTGEDAYVSAVKSFQRMANLPLTGEVDNATMTMMEMPRCGVKDQIGMGNIAKRRKRYAIQGAKWPKGNIMYKYVGPTTPDLTNAKVRSEISMAFQKWSDAVPGLTFSEGEPADLEIRFVSRDHGDGYAFDGRGKTLAHAFFPQTGNMHFDEDEQWTAESTTGTNLLQVAIHELGHSLGLDHSDVRDSIMAPFYRGYVPNVQLHADDIAGIRYLYPERQNIMQNDFCKNDGDINAILSINGTSLAFSGDEFVKIDMNGIVTGYPKKIADVFHNLPNAVDTALYWSVNDPNIPYGSVYFFKDSQVWRYFMNSDLSFNLNGGYPKPITSEFTGLPSNLDAAFIWSGNGKPYFIKENQYYRVASGAVARGYPRRLTAWRGLPASIDVAFSFLNTGRTYFVSGKNYYRFNDPLFKVDAGYPKSFPQCWLGCPISGPQDCEHTMMLEMSEGGQQFLQGDHHNPQTGGTASAASYTTGSLATLLVVSMFS